MSQHAASIEVSSVEYPVGEHPDGPLLRPLRLAQDPTGEVQVAGLNGPRLRPVFRAAVRAQDVRGVRALLAAQQHAEAPLFHSLLRDMVQSGQPEMIHEALRHVMPIELALREVQAPDALTEALRSHAATLAQGGREALFMQAAAAGDWPLLRGLMQDHGLDPAAPGFCAVKRAALAGRHETVRELLRLGEYVNPGLAKLFKPRQRKFPLAYAVESGSLPTLRVLHEAGADPRGYTKSRKLGRQTLCMPMLSLAACLGHTPMIRVLRAMGCDVNDAGTEQWGPLEIALRAGRRATAAELVLCGASAWGVSTRWTAAVDLRTAESAVAVYPMRGLRSPAEQRRFEQVLLPQLQSARRTLAHALRDGTAPMLG